MDNAHTAPAAASCRLDDDWVIEGARELDDFLRVVRQRPLVTRDTRYAGLGHGYLGAYLVSHQPYGFGSRADENEAALLDFFGEVGIFRKKTIAGVNGLGVGHLGSADDRRDIEVALGGGRWPNAYRLIGQSHVFGFGIGFGMHHDGLDAKLPASALDA